MGKLHSVTIISMQKIENISELADHVSNLMVDWNYHPDIYILEITEVETLEDILATIKQEFEDTHPFEEKHIPCTRDEMFDDLRRCFAPDHNPNSDLTVNDIPKAAVKEAWQELLQEIDKYIDDNSKIYASSLEDGLPILDIFWKFAYIILNKDGKSLFLFGAAYD